MEEAPKLRDKFGLADCAVELPNIDDISDDCSNGTQVMNATVETYVLN